MYTTARMQGKMLYVRHKECAFLSPSALSLSLVDALYRSTYPEYLQYIYLVAPVSLMLLNPIGFALCEVQKWRQASHCQHSTLGIVGVVVLQVLCILVNRSLYIVLLGHT